VSERRFTPVEVALNYATAAQLLSRAEAGDPLALRGRIVDRLRDECAEFRRALEPLVTDEAPLRIFNVWDRVAVVVARVSGETVIRFPVMIEVHDA